jgi:hypothetical protein
MMKENEEVEEERTDQKAESEVAERTRKPKRKHMTFTGIKHRTVWHYSLHQCFKETYCLQLQCGR